nr:MAG TPA: hypothetical protein [Caudoviricetes sp.]
MSKKWPISRNSSKRTHRKGATRRLPCSPSNLQIRLQPTT